VGKYAGHFNSSEGVTCTPSGYTYHLYAPEALNTRVVRVCVI